MIGPHVPLARFNSNDGNPFAALAAHVNAADVKRARGLKMTQAARAANRSR